MSIVGYVNYYFSLFMQNLKAINLCILIPFIAFFSVNPLFFGWSGNKSNQFQHFYCFFILIPWRLRMIWQ